MEKTHVALKESLNEVVHLRALTLDLLHEIPESFFVYTPDNSMSVLWKVFRHIGRVDENYTDAIRSGSVQFDSSTGSYTGANNREALIRYLQTTLDTLCEVVGQCKHDAHINWFGEHCSINNHLLRLATHESLHHGQFILYARAAQVPLPSSWSSWGE